MTSYAVAIGSDDDKHDGIFGRKQFEHLYCVEWNLIDNPPTGTHLTVSATHWDLALLVVTIPMPFRRRLGMYISLLVFGGQTICCNNQCPLL